MSSRVMTRTGTVGASGKAARKSPASNQKRTRSSVEEKSLLGRIRAVPSSIMAPRLLFIASVVVLCVMGLVMVYSASSISAYSDYGDSAYYVKRQAVFLAFGVVLCMLCAKISYNFWGRPFVFVSLWVMSMVMLVATAFGFGVSALGAERSIVIAGFALQPAEFAKIFVLMTVASLVQMQRDGRFENAWLFIVLVAAAAFVPLALIYRQPDLGTAIILAVGLVTIAVLAGLRWRVIFAVCCLIVAYVVFACITQPYHLDRILTMFDPWLDPQGDGYQSIQSLYAFGSGGIFGTGLGLSRQKYLYLPYAHTDFIFAIIGEELGLVGTLFVVALFAVFIYSGFRIARKAPDLFGCLLASSMTAMIGFQACVNMASVSGIAPVTGKALPFLSYGGSSLIATMVMVGIILSVSFSSKLGAQHDRRRDDLRIYERNQDGQSNDVPARPKSQRSNHRGTGNVISLHDKRLQEEMPQQERKRSRHPSFDTQGKSRQSSRTAANASASFSSRRSASSRSSSSPTDAAARSYDSSRERFCDSASASTRPRGMAQSHSAKTQGGYARLKAKPSSSSSGGTSRSSRSSKSGSSTTKPSNKSGRTR